MTNPLTLTRGELLRTRNFLAHEWQAAYSGRTFDVQNPATQEVIAAVPDSGAQDARAAADAAHAAFGAWSRRPAKERAQLLKRWNALLLENQEDLARLISLEQGKPLQESRGEVLYGASYIEWFAEEATRVYGDMIPAAVNGRRMIALKEPVGVVAAITPW